MIRPNLLQAEIVTRLRANTQLVQALPEGADGIHEAEWHGTAFEYPCVRVDRPQLIPQPNGGRCADRMANASLEVVIASKRDSSRPASVIMGMVEEALAGRTINTADFTATALRPILMSPVEPSPRWENEWQGRVTFGTVVTEL